MALIDAKTPKVERFEVCIDVFFVKILVLTVIADMFLSSGLARKNKGKGGGVVHQEDHIAEEGGREEAVEAFKVDKPVGGGGGKGGKHVNCEAGPDVCDGGE